MSAPTLDLDAGRELDALVAERVMGWKRMGDDFWQDSHGKPRTLSSTSFGSFAPSTDIAAAWEVVEHMPSRGLLPQVGASALEGGGVEWYCWLLDTRTGETVEGQGFADDAPLAICRAALDASVST